MRLLPALTAIVLLAGCSDQGLTFTPKEPISVDDGTIKGRVCDPSGRTWLPDALAYVNLTDGQGRVFETREAFSDLDGRWVLDDLPGDTEYTIYVQYGPDLLLTETVWLDSGDLVELDEPDCFDPLALDVAVITGDYDDFNIVLNQMGFANYTLIDGLDQNVLNTFLGDPAQLVQYDIIIFNGGHVEEGVIYDLEDATNLTPATNVANIKAYVEAGGSLYASDWAYDVIELAWPDRIDFVGEDLVPNEAQLGDYDVVTAVVSDTALSEFLGSTYLDISYDLPVWPPIVDTADSVSTHLSGSVPYSDGLSEYMLTAVPLLVSFNAGDGKVVFSTFRVARNADVAMTQTLQYMMYNL